MNPFDAILINPILNLLIIFYKTLEALSIPGALGFAIILLTFTIRMALWPLTTTQLKSTKKMAELKPHLDRLKKEHGHDKVKHQQEIGKLYKEHGVNPMAGCLPVLLQMPVFIALYQVLLKTVSVNGGVLNGLNERLLPVLHLKEAPSTQFIFNLADKPNQWSQIGILILVVPVLTGVFQFIQSKMLIAPNTNTKKESKDDKKDKKSESLEDSMAQVSSQMTLIMPAMIAFFSYGFPFGLSLYWNTFTIVGIIQQYKISGAGSLNKYLPKKWQK